MRTFIFLQFIIYSLLFLMVQAQDTVYIPQDYPSIQQGIDAAVDGDFVLVDDGTYLENINFNGKAITLASYFFVDGDTNHINNTIVDGSQPTDPDYGSVVTFNNGEDTTSVICGFTITGGTGTLFPMEQARSGGGILCYNAGAKIIHNVIISNQINHTGNTFGGGIALSSDGSEHLVVLQENSILNNINITTGEWAYGGGICTYLDTRMIDNLIANNSIEGNDAVGGGVICYSMTGSNHILLKNNVINGNEIIGHDVWGGGVGILFSNAEISGNQFNGNVINCERGWGGGVMTQGTIDTLNIIDNEFSGNHIDASDFCVGGGAMFHSPTVYARYAGNVFSDNTAGGTSYGGGLTCNNSNNIPILVEGNLFSDNNSMAGGGVYTGASNIRFVNNLFCSNSVDGAGGGIYVTITTKDISNSGIWQIQGPQENTARDIPRAANISFVNNTFAANNAVYNGGAMRVNYTTETCEIINSIFWDNTANSGNDIHYSGTEEIYIDYCDIDLSNIFGNWTGDNNMNEDPQFMPLDPLYHLSSASPCRDAGILEYYTPLRDFEGDIRPDPAFGLVDLGWDEYYAVPAAPVANDPDTIGDDFFIASWEESAWAVGYYLDVSDDPDFTSFLEGYENLDVGDTTSYLVDNLNAISYYYRIRAYNSAGISENSDVIAVLSVNTYEFLIHNSKFIIDVYPNPTNGISHFAIYISQYQYVTCKIYDMHGREVAVVLDEKLPAGEHAVRYDMTGLPAGVYVVELRAKGLGHRAEGVGHRVVGKVVKMD